MLPWGPSPNQHPYLATRLPPTLPTHPRRPAWGPPPGPPPPSALPPNQRPTIPSATAPASAAPKLTFPGVLASPNTAATAAAPAPSASWGAGSPSGRGGSASSSSFSNLLSGKKFAARPKLNIGGTEFQTSLSTLCNPAGEGSRLHAVFTGAVPAEFDDAGRVWFDASSAHFDAVLDWLRTGDCVTPSDKTGFDGLVRAARYWRMDGLLSRVLTVRRAATAGPMAGLQVQAGTAGPSSKLIFNKWLSQCEGSLGVPGAALVNLIQSTMSEAAAKGYNHVKVVFGASGPGDAPRATYRAPDWGSLVEHSLCVWDPSFAPFFSPTHSGAPSLLAARDFLVLAVVDRGFTAVSEMGKTGAVYSVAIASVSGHEE